MSPALHGFPLQAQDKNITSNPMTYLPYQLKCKWGGKMGKVNSHSHSIIAQSPFFSTGFRHSRPSAVRASMCTRSGSLSKPVTDLGERDRKKENGQLKGCNRAEMVRERKTSLSLLWDTWYVGLHLLMACLLCISTQTTLRGPTQPSQAWTVILPAPRLQQQDYYDCSWGGKETWSPVKSEFCFNAEGKKRAQQPHAFRKQIKERFYLAG